jgi:hypothetical protein
MSVRGERGRLRKYWPFCALCRYCAVNRSALQRALNLFGSPNRYRTLNVLVNSYVFETLCLRMFWRIPDRALHVEAERAFMCVW